MVPTRLWLCGVTLAGGALLVTGAWDVALDEPHRPADAAATAPERPPSRDAYGAWPARSDIGAFTTVETGTVHVDVPSAAVVWRGSQGGSRVIGQLGQDAVAPPAFGWIWGQTRDVVGDPTRDLVAWVERSGAHAGQLVVVRASTGERLATTEFETPLPRPVVITSVDERAVHFAAPDAEGGPSVAVVDFFEQLRGDQIWTWPWAAGRAPFTSQDPDDRLADVDGQVRALDAGRTIRFEDASGALLSHMHPSYTDRTAFGAGLSPGGRYWYAPAYGHVVETRTGTARALAAPSAQDQHGPVVRVDHLGASRWGWTGPTTMTFSTPSGWIDCDADTGACTRPAEQCSFVHCTAGLPAN